MTVAKTEKTTSKNGKLRLVTRGYNNKIYVIDSGELLCEFTDTDVNAIFHMETLSKSFN